MTTNNPQLKLSLEQLRALRIITHANRCSTPFPTGPSPLNVHRGTWNSLLRRHLVWIFGTRNGPRIQPTSAGFIALSLNPTVDHPNVS